MFPEGAGEELRAVESFDDYDLDAKLRWGLDACGFEVQSAFQQRGIKPILDGRDVIGHAPSGAGKTAALVIGVLQRIDPRSPTCQALILVPTRELASAIQKLAQAMGDYMHVRCHACVPRSVAWRDIDRLRDGQHVVVGTPVRMQDMVTKRRLVVDDLVMFALDEVDDLLFRGFEDHICDIFKALPPKIQVCLFSATMTPKLASLAKKYMRDAVEVVAKRGALTLDGVGQFYVRVEEEAWKLDTLCDLYETLYLPLCSPKAVVYCNTRAEVDFLADQLQKRDFTISTTHADMDPEDRDTALRKFRSGSCPLLVSTDLPAGTDTHQAPLVFNYALPRDVESYLRRIGRSGQFGKKGVAISFVTTADEASMERIARHHRTRIQEMPRDLSDLF